MRGLVLKHKALLIVCSRPQSSRLPEKVFRTAGGRSLIGHIWQRVRRIPGVFPILALPRGISPEGVHGYGSDWAGEVTYGNPESPLHRMADLCNLFPAIPWIVRVTHDDPLIDAKTITDLLDACEKTPNCGYGISPGIVNGAGVEVIHRDNLLHAAAHQTEPTEFVSYYVRGKGLPRPVVVKLKPRASIRRDYRLTIDYAEDLQLLQIVLRALGPDATNDAICSFLDRNPHLLRINRLPEVSIYTCAYNASKWIERSMISVLNSMEASTEFILVDDASTDDTVVKATRILHKAPYKLILNQRNLGLASSSNIAIAAARGRYIMRLDADDAMRPAAMSKMLDRIKSKGAAVVYPAYEHIDGKGNRMDDGVQDPAENHHAGCALMDRNMLNEVRFTEGLRNWDSLDLYRRLREKFPVAYIREPLWYYRRHRSQMSRPSAEREKAKERIA